MLGGILLSEYVKAEGVQLLASDTYSLQMLNRGKNISISVTKFTFLMGFGEKTPLNKKQEWKSMSRYQK